MALKTTVIGSFPKPTYLNLPDWFKTGTGADSGNATRQYSDMLAKQSQEEKEQLEADLMRATKEVTDIQTQCGVCVITDGEIRRENYIHYLCRYIEGIDFENLTEVSLRNGAYITQLPTIRNKVSWRGGLDVAAEWRKAQDVSSAPVKYTLPGPTTIIGTLCNDYYKHEKDLAADLAEIINHHVRALSEAGCKNIQVDEPVFARQPQKALDWGIAMLDKCFEGAAPDIRKVTHMCCGYPEYLDQVGYLKAEPSAYFKPAEALDRSVIDAVSIEDAHRYNDLALLSKFKKTTVIMGVVQSASSRVESAGEIEDRLRDALQYIDADRLMVAPDCGLALLPMDILKEKLTNMCIAAAACGCKKMRSQ
jgi:5-methyltetrahydropteroyltriglutamate--homocysteine methyltransferase